MGDSIRLKITTAGRPKPEVNWYHNGEMIEKNDRIDIVNSETGSMLKIDNACRNDRGEYVIVGVNKIGDDTASFLVTVTGTVVVGVVVVFKKKIIIFKINFFCYNKIDPCHREMYE